MYILKADPIKSRYQDWLRVAKRRFADGGIARRTQRESPDVAKGPCVERTHAKYTMIRGNFRFLNHIIWQAVPHAVAAQNVFAYNVYQAVSHTPKSWNYPESLYI